MTSAPDVDQANAALQKLLRDLQPSPQKIKLLATFDSMKILKLPEAIDLLADDHDKWEDRELFMKQLRARLFTPEDEKYFYDPAYKWDSRFDTPILNYRRGEPIPFSVSCSGKETDRYAGLPGARGYYQGTSCDVADVSLKYDSSLDAVTFRMLFRLGIRLFVKELRRGVRDYGERDIPSAFASLPFRYDILYTTLILKIPVPLSLLYTLARRKSRDKAVRVFVKKEEDETIEYDIRDARYKELSGQYVKDNPYSYSFKYRRSFIEWIYRNGLGIFAILRDGDCRIDDKVRLAIKNSMINLDILDLPNTSTPQPSKQEIEHKSALVEEAMKIPDDDRKRLKAVCLVKGILSYSQWAERLWFKNKSKGAVGAFFKRMQERGLLRVTKKAGAKKNQGATIVELTQKANDILQAWDEHLALHR